MGREDQGRAILVSGSRSVNRIVDRRRLIAMSQRKRRGAKAQRRKIKELHSSGCLVFSATLRLSAFAPLRLSSGYCGRRKFAPRWQRAQSLNARSPPKDLLPLWQVEQFMPPAGKCSAGAGELTWRDCSAPAVRRWQSAQSSRSRRPCWA